MRTKESTDKYAKPISLYPLKPEEALFAFMKVNPKKLRAKERKIKAQKSGAKSQ
ncbi:MAG: hypothetical protein WB930_19255 [Syntrophobacteraceae bacterium]